MLSASITSQGPPCNSAARQGLQPCRSGSGGDSRPTLRGAVVLAFSRGDDPGGVSTATYFLLLDALGRLGSTQCHTFAPSRRRRLPSASRRVRRCVSQRG